VADTEVEIDGPMGAIEPTATLPSDPEEQPPEMPPFIEVEQLPIPDDPNEI
jgi:hypothetical protein